MSKECAQCLSTCNKNTSVNMNVSFERSSNSQKITDYLGQIPGEVAGSDWGSNVWDWKRGFSNLQVEKGGCDVLGVTGGGG